ncbi:DUF2058 domain-containing protein [Sulfuriflexus mobilis]|uniref:DUF2058 domain-containing protein n=1 Tax=Sulfuriflexus mobilis TaxID=1811807 RepID=UPI000F823D30|nr:DUF2058 domain-containing protein [Sulfuriflexus mobilis]
MGNPFQDQLLKAGLVSKQQVNKVKNAAHKKKKQQGSKKAVEIDETKLKAAQAAKEKAALDRELNKKKEQQARKKALSAEIDQLITTNRIERGDDCELVYNFEHMKKIERIYITAEMKKHITQGTLGIARIDSRYELVPKAIAKKIQQRDAARIILFSNAEQAIDEDDPYADYQIPDDLTW